MNNSWKSLRIDSSPFLEQLQIAIPYLTENYSMNGKCHKLQILNYLNFHL